jgi:hypothetical protein
MQLTEKQIFWLNKIKTGFYTYEQVPYDLRTFIKDLISKGKIVVSHHRRYLEITDHDYTDLVEQKSKVIRKRKENKLKLIRRTVILKKYGVYNRKENYVLTHKGYPNGKQSTIWEPIYLPETANINELIKLAEQYLRNKYNFDTIIIKYKNNERKSITA